MEKQQIDLLGTSTIVRVPNLVIQPKPAGAGQTSISTPYKIYFPSGKGRVIGIRADIVQATSRDFDTYARSCLSMRVQVQSENGTRELSITGQGEGYTLFKTIDGWQRLKNIPFDSALPWNLYIQNEDASTSPNAGYIPAVHLAVVQD